MASSRLISLLAVVLFISDGVFAWGALGHQAVGYISMSFLGPKALSFVRSNIDASDDHSLGPASTWADSVRSTAKYRFTSPFHYVDAEDDPLNNQCSVNQDRDCGSSGCILSAIANYTQRVADSSLPTAERQDALKFVTHFIGDIGQPLHVEALEVGGNDIKAICGGRSTNLHAAWDTGIPSTYLNANFSGSSQTWASSIVTKIKSGSFARSAPGWVSCSSVAGTRPIARKAEMMETISARSEKRAVIPKLACPLQWAQEANKFDCSTVFKFQEGQDLCTGSYYTMAIPIIEMQIAKQGLRLATWLNVIFDGSPLFP